MHLKGLCWEVDWLFPIWKTVMTGRKTKKKTNRPPSIFIVGHPQGWVFLKLILPSTVATWELGIPGSGCRSPGRLRCDSLLEIESLGRLHVSLLRIGSKGRSRHFDLLGPLNWWIPEQVEVWQPPEDQIPRQVEVGWTAGTPGWGWASPRSPGWPVLGRIKWL